MKWLQWAPEPFESKLGGVEIHAHSLNRELRKLNIDAHLGSGSEILQEKWDIIQTHGCNPLPLHLRKLGPTRPVSIHTLHGTTLGRMAACREWLWPGGYKAYYNEIKGVIFADLVASIHPNLHLSKLALFLKKPLVNCSNGWDSGEKVASPLPTEIAQTVEAKKPFFCYVGRSNDKVKNIEFTIHLFKKLGVNLLALPGIDQQGLPENIISLGQCSPTQVIQVLEHSQGLILNSKYEGLPLVVLEALGSGVPVFTTQVGGLSSLSKALMGLTFLPKNQTDMWMASILEASKQNDLYQQKNARAAINRQILPTWKQVASLLLGSVSEHFSIKP